MTAGWASPAIAGLLLGFSLIIAIGAQNAFVLKLGILRKHVFIIALICALSDALLIAAGVAGFGTFVQSSPKLIFAVTILGSVFLAVYGAMAFYRTFTSHKMVITDTQPPALWPTITTVLALTFLNPHVYLDTVVLLGGLSGQYHGSGRTAYALGAATASFIWFFALGYGARILAPIFTKPFAWKILDFSIGVVMWSIAARLVYSHFQF
jgi:L-lysine exporter family protein LysE/ArgO